MPEMNKPGVNIPTQGWNPGNAINNKLNSAASGLGSISRDTRNIKAAIHMQGQQHEHEKVLQAGQHEHERGIALIGGAVDIEKAKIEGRAAVHVARAHGASQVDVAKVQADSALKQQSAGHRHEIRLGVQTHQQDLEKQAQTHHETVQAGLYDSLNRRAEQQQQNDHALATQKLADTHAGNASTRTATFLETLRKHAQPGTEVNLSHEGVNASFTSRAEKPAAPAAPEAPTPTPVAEAPKEESKKQMYAHRDPVTNKISHYEETPQVLKPAKRTAKKAAPKKKK